MDDDIVDSTYKHYIELVLGGVDYPEMIICLKHGHVAMYST